MSFDSLNFLLRGSFNRDYEKLLAKLSRFAFLLDIAICSTCGGTDGVVAKYSLRSALTPFSSRDLSHV